MISFPRHRRSVRTRLQTLVVVIVCLLAPVGLAQRASAASGFSSDDFSGSSLSSVWSVVDPVGDGVVRLAGQGSSAARVELSVPAGQSHDSWNVNRALRLMQPVSDVSLGVAAKFDSVPSLKYQDQGLSFEQDADNWLRFDVYSDGSRLYAFAAATVGGKSTKKLSKVISASSSAEVIVNRSGTTWQMQVALDGAAPMTVGSFTQALTLAKVGPYAGNSGTMPAWTAAVDYVFDVAAPISPEDGGAPDPGPTPGDTTPPVISGVSVAPSSTSAQVSWATDELSTGAVAFGLTSAYGSTVPATVAGSTQSVTLSGLSPATTYHFRVQATDASGNTSTSTDKTFTTAQADPGSPAGSGFSSDDFSGSSLSSVWSVVDPVGDGVVRLAGQGSSAARVELSVPAGQSHDSWNVNRALRLMQPVSDVSLGVAAKFDSVPSLKYQDQGLSFEQDADNWLRFDVYSDGSRLYAFAAATVGGKSTKKLSKVISASSSAEVIVNRSGTTWQMQVALDGAAPMTVGSFTQALTLAKVGPYAGNSGTMPAWTAAVDYVFDVAAPISPEDGGAPDPGPTPGDTTPPVISGVSVAPSSTSAQVSWATDELSTGAVAFGLTSAYGSTVPATVAGSTQSVTLSGLSPATTYHFRVQATDASGNTSTSTDKTFTTALQNAGPAIDVWYGDVQTVGADGQPQVWVNVLGNVADSDGVSSLEYQLNGGAWTALTMGPDNRRLQAKGDFNADVAWSKLTVGDNSVRIRAVDSKGASSSRGVTIRMVAGTASAPQLRRQWSESSPLHSQAQPVDGRWQVQGSAVRSIAPGYDRVLALGDIGWKNYEVTVPITPVAAGPHAFSYLSGAPLVGVAVGWHGHDVVDSRQPAWGFYGTGAYAWVRWYDTGTRLELIGTAGSPKAWAPATFPYGTTQYLKVRANTLSDGTVRYSVKLWAATSSEPAAWTRVIDETAGPDSGSIALISHQMDAKFGTVTVEPIQ